MLDNMSEAAAAERRAPSTGVNMESLQSVPQQQSNLWSLKADEEDLPKADTESSAWDDNGLPEPTTGNELWGWYLFEAASSGFSSSVLPIFLPLLMVVVATEQAWIELGSSSPVACSSTTTLDCVKCVPGKGARLLTLAGLHDLPKLRVHIGNLGIDAVSYTTVALGISVIFQLLASVSAGPLVDYGNKRKNVMTVSTLIGSAACVLCVMITKPDLWWLGAVLLIIANVTYGLSCIAYNSYLPLLTEASSQMQDSKSMSSLEQQLVRHKVANEISLVGITVGAVSGAACVGVSFGFAFLPGVSQLELLRAIGGLWWLVGYIPSALWLKRRTGPKLPADAKPWLGWSNVRALIKESKQHKYAWRFLLIFFIYSDGFTTINQVGVLFAQQDLCMSTAELALLAVLVNLAAMVGNPLFAFIQQKFNLDNNQMLILGLSLLSVLPLYGVIGYFTPDGSFGLKHAAEMYTFACWYGLSLCALLSYSRTLFIDLIPVGKEGAMFSIWSLSSRGSAWVGPLLVAAMVQFTGSLISAFDYSLLVVCVSIVLLYLFIDNREGLLQSGRLSVEAPFEPSKGADFNKKAPSTVDPAEEESQHMYIAGAL